MSVGASARRAFAPAAAGGAPVKGGTHLAGDGAGYGAGRRRLAGFLAVFLLVLAVALTWMAGGAAAQEAPPPAGQEGQGGAGAGQDSQGGQGADGASLHPLPEIMDLIRSVHPNAPNREDLIKAAVKGMLESLGDPYSYYLDPEEYRGFSQEIRGFFGGVGVVVESREGVVTVVSVLPGTPADREGFEPGDQVVAVDGRSIEGLDVNQAVRLIRGDPGTKVRLRVRRQGRTFDKELTRAVIEVPAVDTRYLDEARVGYVKVTEFSAGVGDQVAYIYRRYSAMRVRGVILDLRNNPGGLLEEAVTLADALVPRGNLVQVVDSRGGKMTVPATGHAPGPFLVVLVNGGSASAAEVVAGAVQDTGAGVLVGTKTFGKASVQDLIPLPNGGAVRLTVARYLTPAGRLIDGRGLVPDVAVEEADPHYQPPPFAALGKRSLRPGLVGLDVLGLQQRLRYLGYDPGPDDGVYGARTRRAVVAFQRAQGIRERDAGSRTLAALERAVQRRVEARRKDGGDRVFQRALALIAERARVGAAGATAAAGGGR